MRDLLSIGTSRGCEMIGTGIGLGLSGYRFNPAGVLPVLDINFSDFKSFSSAIGPTASFSRASSGTYFDETGVLRTASTNVGRINHVYDGTGWVCKGGLIEEQRTNIALQSSTLNTSPWTAFNTTATEGAAPSPDGTSNSSKLMATTTNGAHYHYQSIASTAATYTISFYAKSAGYNFVQFSSGIFVDYANFNLNTGTVGNKTLGITASISNVGNGWYRCACTFTSLSGSYDFGLSVINADTASRRPSFAGDGTSGILIYGFQKEMGSFSTSAIPTTSASATRSADVMQITGSNFSSFWNQSEGTFATDCDANGFNASGVNYMGVASTGGLSQYAFVGRFQGSLSSLNYQVYNGSPDCSITLTPAGSNPTKSAFGFKANDCAASANGGAVSTDTTVAMTTALTQLEIGNFLGNNYLNGHIARLRYWNTRLDNATLRALST
jgi:hypothetical protein